MRTEWKTIGMKTLVIQSVVLLVSAGSAMALGVSPGAFCAQGVPVGVKMDTGVDVTITNDTDKERVFSVKVDKMAAGQEPSLRGYTSMPDLSWVVLDKAEVTAPPKGQAGSRMTINIPDDEQYYNQQWGVSCLIEYSGQKGLFQEAVKTAYMFETKSKADIKGRPWGTLGVAPSIATLDPSEKKTRSAKFKIYNNTGEVRTYTLTASVPGAGEASLKLSVSPGFEWMQDAGKMRIKPEKVKIKPGGTAEATVSTGLSNEAIGDGRKLECVVFVESDKAEARFVRVHVEKVTEEPPPVAGKNDTAGKSPNAASEKAH
jgi:hypothetical protein